MSLSLSLSLRLPVPAWPSLHPLLDLSLFPVPLPSSLIAVADRD